MAYTIKEKFELISKKMDEVGANAVNYVFFADSHVDEYLRRDEEGKLTVFEAEESVEKRLSNLVAHLNEAVAFAEKNEKIDFIAFGGDALNAYNIRGKQAVIEMLNRSFEPLRRAKKPVLLCFGNHDDNGFQTLNPDVAEIKNEWLISDKDWCEKVMDLYPFAEGRVHDKNYPYSKYFYFDLAEKTTRVVVLDTMDMRKSFDENGEVVEKVNRLPRFWYTFEQLDWLCKQVFCAPDGWDYIILSHMGIQNDTSDNCKNGENLRKIFKAFKERGAVQFDYTDMTGKTVCVNADFGNVKEGKILLYHFGHQHAEMVHYSEDIDLWQIATGCENAWAGWGSGPSGGDPEIRWVPMKDRTEGTECETCFDVFSANRKICYKFNIGPGEDAEMIYEK